MRPAVFLPVERNNSGNDDYTKIGDCVRPVTRKDIDIKKLRLVTAAVIVLLSSLISAYLFVPSVYQSLDDRLRDYIFLVRGKIPTTGNVVIIDINEQSLKQLGQWPWQRYKVARILDNLAAAGAGVIGLDIVFAEPDNSSPRKVFSEISPDDSALARAKLLPDFDEILARAIGESPTIAGYVFAMEDDGIKPGKGAKQSASFIEKNKPDDDYMLAPYRAILNLNNIQEASYSSAYFNTIPDDSGMVRSIPMVMRYKESIYPALSLEMIRVGVQAKKVFINYEDGTISSLKVGDITIPTDRHGRLFINFRGPGKTFKYLSAADIFDNKFKKEDIEGKFILIGTSAAGLLDLRATPFDNVYPGVEVHANAIDNILAGDFISRPAWAEGADIVIMAVVVILLSIVLAFSSAVVSFASLLISIFGTAGFLYYMLIFKGIVLNTLFPFVAIVVTFIVLMALNYFLEGKLKDLVKRKFATKVSPAVMEDLLKNPDSDVFAAHEREITVFFSDVRNFTNISESLHDPKTLIQLMNEYMDPMTDIIIKTGGTVDKFIGDAIMAYWNAPGDVPDHPDKAVTATLMQLHYLRPLNIKIKADPRFVNMVKMAEGMGADPIDIGMGINTGVAIVGEMGSSSRSDYTAIGDPINLGARLESLCKYYNSKCNISSFVKDRLKPEKYIFRFLDLVTVKGKKEPVEVWQIHDFTDGLDGYFLFKVTKERLEEELTAYHHAIELYKAAKFAEALEIFKEINAWEDKSNKYIYNIYIERCEHYIKEPPTDFTGVFVHTTKG